MPTTAAWIQDFVESLQSGTIANPGVEEAIAIKQTHLPKKIYKYRCDSVYARENLKTNTVWMACPDTYNDPYDCAFKVAEGEVVAALKKSVLTDFAKHYKLEDQEAAEATEKALSSDGDPLLVLGEYIAIAKGETPGSMAQFHAINFPAWIGDTVAFLRQWRKATKVCSFSASNDSILMWGHYGNHHRGFCMEYDLEEVGPDHPFRRNLYPVIYSSELYDLTGFMEKLVGPNRQEFNLSAPILSVLHKFHGWKYEQEWRAIAFTPAVISDYSWSVPKPSRVFLGSKMDPDHAKEIAAICEGRHIEVWQMAMAPDNFQLEAHPYVPSS